MQYTYPLVRAQRVEGRVELLAGLKVLTLAVHTPVVVNIAIRKKKIRTSASCRSGHRLASRRIYAKATYQ